MGAAALRDRLTRTYGDPAAGVEARRAAAELATWQAHAARSYAWQTGLILAHFLDRARTEVAGLVQQIRDTANRDAVDERLRRRQRTIGLILKTFGWTLFAALALLAFAAAVGWVSWKFALITGGVLAGAVSGDRTGVVCACPARSVRRGQSAPVPTKSAGRDARQPPDGGAGSQPAIGRLRAAAGLEPGARRDAAGPVRSRPAAAARGGATDRRASTIHPAGRGYGEPT